MTALVARGIAAGRLKAFGAGPYCPIAFNRDDAGRAQNGGFDSSSTNTCPSLE